VAGLSRKSKLFVGAGLAAGLALVVGVAHASSPAPPPVPLSDGDTTYACVTDTGQVRPSTVKLDVVPSTCPRATDVVRSWSPSSAPAVISTAFDANSFSNILPVGTRVVVTSLDLPAGNWDVSADLNASIVAPSGHCELVRSGIPVELDSRDFGATLTPGYVPKDDVSAQIPVHLDAPVTLTSPTTVQAQCVTFGTSAFTSVPFQVRGARMTATAVGTVTVVPSP
jgi:hypothetical protein